MKNEIITAECGIIAPNAAEMDAGYVPILMPLTDLTITITDDLHIVITIRITEEALATMATVILRPHAVDLPIGVDTMNIRGQHAITQLDFRIAGKIVHVLDRLWLPGLHHHLIIHVMYNFGRPHQSNRLHKSPFSIQSVTSWALIKINIVCKYPTCQKSNYLCSPLRV